MEKNPKYIRLPDRIRELKGDIWQHVIICLPVLAFLFPFDYKTSHIVMFCILILFYVVTFWIQIRKLNIMKRDLIQRDLEK